ncbi:MAG: response regulator [Elusimicrobia bacterium]|nr:response regulator [Elusimicrobiota bacterium]
MPLRILVVDDSIVTRSLIQEFSECFGHQVVAEAATLTAAVAAYKEHKPDLVTLDLSLADGDGLAVLKALRRIDPAARVLVVSGNVQQAVHDEVRDAGAAGFLSKPFTLDDLGRALTRFSQG